MKYSDTDDSSGCRSDARSSFSVRCGDSAHVLDDSSDTREVSDEMREERGRDEDEDDRLAAAYESRWMAW